MTNTAQLSERAERAEVSATALRELDSAFDEVVAAYMARMTKIASTEPWEARKITNLAMAAQIAAEVRGFIAARAADGPVVRAELNRIRKIENMSPERRKVLGMTIPGVV